MIKRATILKILKHYGKYERRHFTMKKKELEDECKKLGIDLTQNIDEQPVKEVVKAKKKVVIQEPDSSSDESSDEDEPVPQTPVPSPATNPVPTPVPSPVPTPVPSPKVAKKLSRKQNKVEKMDKTKTDPDNKVKVNEILKDLNKVIKELFGEFDQKDLDQDDVNYIQSEFNLTINECQDLIDPLVADFSDSEIAKIENKIDLMYKKLDRFLS